MTAETRNARGELRMADIREDAREPLQLLREKLAHDEDGWAALCQLMPMLAAAPPPSVPVGWKLVPVDPTEAMLDAAMQREDDEPLSDWGKVMAAPHEAIYAAMLSAAPALAQQPADVVVDDTRRRAK